MKARLLYLVCAAAMLVATGCATRATVSACAADCYVYDHVSREAIVNAKAYVVYRGNRGEKFERGPFLSDKDGMVRVTEGSHELLVPFGEQQSLAYYRRGIEVRVDGYLPERVFERQAKFDRKTTSPLQFPAPLEEMGPFFFYLDRIVPNQHLSTTDQAKSGDGEASGER
jgi:hypothetical protein